MRQGLWLNCLGAFITITVGVVFSSWSRLQCQKNCSINDHRLQEPSIASLARGLHRQWQRVCGRHLAALSDPAYLADPRAEAAALLRYASERVAAAKRPQQPAAPAAPQPPASQPATGPALSAGIAGDAAAPAAGSSAAPGMGTSVPAHAGGMQLPEGFRTEALRLPEGFPPGASAHDFLALLQQQAGAALVLSVTPCKASSMPDHEKTVKLNYCVFMEAAILVRPV
jgi:hypothetical protein